MGRSVRVWDGWWVTGFHERLERVRPDALALQAACRCRASLCVLNLYCGGCETGVEYIILLVYNPVFAGFGVGVRFYSVI